MKLKALALSLCALSLSSFSYAENTIYSVDEKEYEGYWLSADKKSPLVVLVHDWDGLTDYEIKRAKMLREMGYSVFAVDLFGKGVRPSEVKDKKQHTGELYTNREKLQKLMNVGMAKAKMLGGNIDNAVLMGYCFGGAAVLEAARAGIKAKGFVTFHGGLSTPKNQNYAKTKAPIMVLHGTADAAIPMTEFAKLAIELEKFNVPHEMITYSGAEHAFTVFDTPKYQKQADEKSWTAFSHFLKTHTKS